MSLKRRRDTSPTAPCPLSQCMDLIGGAWTPNIIWYLSQGARRFSELRADIPMISSKVLTTRLRELESKGAIARKVQPTSPPSVEYELTALGLELMPAIQAIVDVSYRLKSKKMSRRKAA